MEAYRGEPAGGGGGERGKGVQPVGVSVETLEEGVEALGVGVWVFGLQVVCEESEAPHPGVDFRGRPTW